MAALASLNGSPVIGESLTIPAGIGYFDLSIMPIGGDYRKFKTDTVVTLTKEINSHGMSFEAILPQNSKRIALNLSSDSAVPVIVEAPKVETIIEAPRCPIPGSPNAINIMDLAKLPPLAKPSKKGSKKAKETVKEPVAITRPQTLLTRVIKAMLKVCSNDKFRVCLTSFAVSESSIAATDTHHAIWIGDAAKCPFNSTSLESVQKAIALSELGKKGKERDAATVEVSDFEIDVCNQYPNLARVIPSMEDYTGYTWLNPDFLITLCQIAKANASGVARIGIALHKTENSRPIPLLIPGSSDQPEAINGLIMPMAPPEGIGRP